MISSKNADKFISDVSFYFSQSRYIRAEAIWPTDKEITSIIFACIQKTIDDS
jgi:hypothetical protein